VDSFVFPSGSRRCSATFAPVAPGYCAAYRAAQRVLRAAVSARAHIGAFAASAFPDQRPSPDNRYMPETKHYS